MDNAAILAKIREHALKQDPILLLVDQRVYVSRADVVGVHPCIVLEAAGGPGYLNQAHYQADVRVHIWSALSWAECYEVQNAFANVFEGADYTQDGGALPSPLISISAGAPMQMPQGDYYHLVQDYQVKAKEA